MSEPNLNERITSAAAPKTAGAMEERRRIAEYLSTRAAKFARPSVAAYELERMAREIRDGAHARDGS